MYPERVKILLFNRKMMDCANFDQHMTCLEDSNSTGTLKKPILMIAFITEETKTFDNTLVTKNQGFWPKNITKGCFECFTHLFRLGLQSLWKILIKRLKRTSYNLIGSSE